MTFNVDGLKPSIAFKVVFFRFWDTLFIGYTYYLCKKITRLWWVYGRCVRYYTLI